MILDFNKTKKLRTSAEHSSIYMSDSGIAGTYVPNMSKSDMEKWKAKHIKGDNERIEIRKTLGGTQLLIIVRKNAPMKYPKSHDRETWKQYNDQKGSIKMSMNGSLWMTFEEQNELINAIEEAKTILGI